MNKLFATVSLLSFFLLQACHSPSEPAAESTPRLVMEESVTAGNHAEADSAATLITAELLREHVVALSDDRMAGRAPASPGDQMARIYLVERLAELGYAPGAVDGGWQQAFDLVGVDSTIPDHWRFRSADGELELARHEQFVATSEVQSDRAEIRDAEVVFVGYGIQAPEYQWDDFKGMDLRGKVLLMLNNDPDWDAALFAGDTRLYYGRWTYKYESAARQGAAGAIIIHTRDSAGYPYQVIQTSNEGERFQIPADSGSSLEIAAWLEEAAAGELVKFSGFDLDALVAAARSRDFTPQPLGIRTSLALINTVRRVQTANVLGVLTGSDPALAREAVIYSAHHDHLGVGEADAGGDTIYNGALDNGAGMAQVLAIARAFSELPEQPRRSILIAFVGAEEQGLLGSAYYAQYPSFAPGRIAANINYDSGNIWGRTSDLSMLGYGKSTLDQVVIEVAAAQGRTVKPDQLPDRGYFYRSDQFNFARIGVPAMYLKTGSEFIGRPPGWGVEQILFHEEHYYHQPGDEIRDDWDFAGMVEDARLGFEVGLRVANAGEMPVWYPGDEFEAARRQELEEVSKAEEDPSGKYASWREEVRAAESAFAAMARAQGVKEAFLAFAAEDAVLNRNNRLIQGRQAIKEHFENQTLKDVVLEWSPEFIDVAAEGDIAYTYGNYQFSARDADGKLLEDKGIFHTVWKRQADGSWKFVWD